MRTMIEMAIYEDKHGFYGVGTGLSFRVRIIDARERFGEIDYLIVPVTGTGQQWVASHKVKVEGN